MKRLVIKYTSELKCNLILSQMKNITHLVMRMSMGHNQLELLTEMATNTSIISLDVEGNHYLNAHDNALTIEKMVKALPSLETLRYCEELLPSTFDVIGEFFAAFCLITS